jgi:hypothetical protein
MIGPWFEWTKDVIKEQSPLATRIMLHSDGNVIFVSPYEGDLDGLISTV